LRRWLERPDFRAAYADASRQRLGETVGRLRAVAAEAVDTLRAALSDEHTGHRIRAAIALLDTAVKVEVDDLARRVELLESAQRGNGAR
jgi:HEAT repeat protein